MALSAPPETAPVPRPKLPLPLRVAAVAEALYLPMGLFLVLNLPLDDPWSFVMVGAQLSVAVAAFLGLRRGSRGGWVMAMVLAVYMLVGLAERAPPLLADTSAFPDRAIAVALVIMGWVALTQLVVLVACLWMLPRRHEPWK